MELVDFELKLVPNSYGAYHVRSLPGPDNSPRLATTTSRFRYLESRLKTLSDIMAGNDGPHLRAYKNADFQLARVIGSSLFKSLISGEVKRAYLAQKELAAQKNALLRVTLDLTEAPRLRNIPWELLKDDHDGTYVSAVDDKTFTRLTNVEQIAVPKRVPRPLRVCIVSAKPKGKPELRIDDEVSGLRRVIQSSKGFELQHFDNCTLTELHDELLGFPHGHFDILHFIGHAGLDADPKACTLSFQNAQGELDNVDAERFSRAVRDRGIPLAILNACQGARADPASPFGDLVSRLLQTRFTAVIAMQYEITDKMATYFSHALYANLAKPGLPIDVAVSKARSSIFIDKETLEWATPVLYLGSHETQVFEFSAPVESLSVSTQAIAVRPQAEPPAEARRNDPASRAFVLAKRLLTSSLFRRLAGDTAGSFADAVLNELLNVNGGDDSTLLRYTRWFIELTLLRHSAERADPREGPAGITEQLLTWLTQSPEQHIASHEPTFRYISMQGALENATFPITTRFALDGLFEEEPSAKRYFDALFDIQKILETEGPSTISLGDPVYFVTFVEINIGFLAPLYLLTGTLTEFKEQWQSALKGFEAANGPNDSTSHGSQLQKLQAFLWYCWILWGPSIQVCKCNKWIPGSTLLQYGYGDENNSLPVLIENDWQQLTERSWETIRKYMQDDGGPPYPLAVQTALSAKIACARRYLKRRNTPLILKPSGPEDPEDDRLLLIVQRAIPGPESVHRNEPYYSAYLWVMFEICDPAKSTGFLDDDRSDQLWRRFFPVFEHANIANASALFVLKQQLARKALSTIQDMERRFTRPDEPVFFRYVCAIDDTGSFEDAKTSHKIRFNIEGAEPFRIRSIMEQELSFYKSLDAGRLFPPLDRRLPNGEKRYASCDLPEILSDFFDYVKRAGTP